jgi:hypothetical protein
MILSPDKDRRSGVDRLCGAEGAWISGMSFQPQAQFVACRRAVEPEPDPQPASWFNAVARSGLGDATDPVERVRKPLYGLGRTTGQIPAGMLSGRAMPPISRAHQRCGIARKVGRSPVSGSGYASLRTRRARAGSAMLPNTTAQLGCGSSWVSRSPMASRPDTGISNKSIVLAWP